MNSALNVTSLFYRLFEFEVYYVPFCLTSTGSARSLLKRVFILLCDYCKSCIYGFLRTTVSLNLLPP
jgi:hypothetical protein